MWFSTRYSKFTTARADSGLVRILRFARNADLFVTQGRTQDLHFAEYNNDAILS
jgi:hypothetical protein